tara:strand:- start:152 stop:478 length:327 start_codon:yes stop_codon:yes gene_type:complete
VDDVEHVAKSEFILRLLRCVLDDDKDVVIDTTSKSPLFPDFFDAHLRIRKVVVSKSALTDLLPSPRLCVLHFCGVVVVVVVVVVVLVVAPVVVVVVPNMVSRTTPVVE